jgi:hypothetical protein
VSERVLRRIQANVRAGEFDVTRHAEDETCKDGFTVYDIEMGILSGMVMERQKDKNTGERKYRIRGDTDSGRQIEVVAKLSPLGRVIVITVYEP